MKKTLSVIILLIAAVTAEAAKINYAKLIPANSSEITFTGRTETVENGAVKFDWSGVYLRTKFTGSGVAVNLKNKGKCAYNVFIDDKCTGKIFDTVQVAHNLVLAEGLKNGLHELRLQKCTEGTQGCSTVFGLYIDKGASLKKVEPKKRFIEVFGDSYTCGYGTEALSYKERFKPETENCDKAYGCIVARYFDADYSIAAHSGFGMVRNYGSKDQTTKENMSKRQWYTLDENGTNVYNDSTRRPDIVIINLGTNDFSGNNTPREHQFVGGYVKFIKNIRTRYGQVPIICVIPHTACQYLKTCMKMIQDSTRDMGNIEMVGFNDSMVTVKYDTGADGHPNYAGHRKISMTLIPVISKLTGWQLEDKVVK